MSWNELVRLAGREFESARVFRGFRTADHLPLTFHNCSVATHTFYPLMTLVHVSYTTLSKSRPSTFSSNPIFKPLVISLAYALDGILTPREGKTRMKGAMQKGAIARTRRVLRSVSCSSCCRVVAMSRCGRAQNGKAERKWIFPLSLDVELPTHPSNV